MTNADKIRVMSETELAILLENHSCGYCPMKDDCGGRVRSGREKCHKYWLGWLRKEEEE